MENLWVVACRSRRPGWCFLCLNHTRCGYCGLYDGQTLMHGIECVWLCVYGFVAFDSISCLHCLVLSLALSVVRQT